MSGETGLQKAVVFTCAFCAARPVVLLWPEAAIRCPGCGAESDALGGAGDPALLMSDMAQQWNQMRRKYRYDRLLDIVTHSLAALARIPLPNRLAERFTRLDSPTEAEAEAMRAALDRARRQIISHCPKQYRQYLEAEFRYVDAARLAHVEQGFAGEAVENDRAADRQRRGGERTYTIDQLRGAWGAGFHKGREAK